MRRSRRKGSGPNAFAAVRIVTNRAGAIASAAVFHALAVGTKVVVAFLVDFAAQMRDRRLARGVAGALGASIRGETGGLAAVRVGALAVDRRLHAGGGGAAADLRSVDLRVGAFLRSGRGDGFLIVARSNR